MIQYLNKIFNTKIPNIFSSDRIFIHDLQKINKLFSQQTDQPKTDREQHASIVTLFEKIRAQIRIDLHFYYMKKNDHSQWKDHKGNDVKPAFLFEYLNKNIEKVFAHEIQVHSAPLPLSKKFLSFRLTQRYYYIIGKEARKLVTN